MTRPIAALICLVSTFVGAALLTTLSAGFARNALTQLTGVVWLSFLLATIWPQSVEVCLGLALGVAFAAECAQASAPNWAIAWMISTGQGDLRCGWTSFDWLPGSSSPSKHDLSAAVMGFGLALWLSRVVPRALGGLAAPETPSDGLDGPPATTT